MLPQIQRYYFWEASCRRAFGGFCQGMPNPNHDLATPPPPFRSQHQPMGHGVVEAHHAAGSGVVHDGPPNGGTWTTGQTLEFRGGPRPLHELGRSGSTPLEPHVGQHARGPCRSRPSVPTPSRPPIAGCHSREMAQRRLGLARRDAPQGRGHFGGECVAGEPMVHCGDWRWTQRGGQAVSAEVTLR